MSWTNYFSWFESCEGSALIPKEQEQHIRLHTRAEDSRHSQHQEEDDKTFIMCAMDAAERKPSFTESLPSYLQLPIYVKAFVVWFGLVPLFVFTTPLV